MTNQITLSLITAAVLGLNGCGGSSSNTTPATEEVTSITKLSEASQKHSKAEWDKLENEIQALDNTKDFNTMLLGSTEKNVASLTKVDIDKEMAYAMNSDVMFDDLTDLDLENLDNQVAIECTDNETCKEEAYASLNVEFEIDKEEAYAMSVMYRGDIIKKPSTMDKLLKDFTCEAGLKRNVQFYGVEDNFSTANGDEVAYPSTQVVNNAGIQAYGGTGLSNYDFSTQNTLFAEEVKNLPSSIANGHFYIGMKNYGSNDGITLGNLDENSSTQDVVSKTISNNDADLQKDGSVYHQDLATITLADGNTLEQYAYNNQGFDVYVQDDTFVDFIAVATCSKPNPIADVTTIVDKFECSEKETMVKILGGEIDAFASATDSNPANPTTALKTSRDVATAYPNVVVDYDYTAYDHHFIDTLNLNLTSSQTVTKAEFNIGYKVIGSSLASNDAIYIGDYLTNHAGGHLYDNQYPIIPQGWNVHDLTSNYGYVANVNLFQLLNNTGASTGMVANTMISQNKLDVYVQDDTAVDFTQLNLCVTDNCSEKAKDIELDLSQLASWTDIPSDARENRAVSSWDNTLNWFQFDNNQKDKVLKIPFCACGDTLVNIEHLKGDNIAEVKLDGTSVAYQAWSTNGVTGFISDSAGGNHVDGSESITGTGLGVNHTLELKARNLYSSGGSPTPFGIAVQGTLNFKGYLGKCN